ncbi:MAG: hypothetical protein J6T82_07370 [Bacteroidaceae bacterium]|nr:hypothetical protein [Bacteroidaceae bacterium]
MERCSLRAAIFRTAAVPTCLHIPMKLNRAYFPFPVLAPPTPGPASASDWAVNAD